MVVNLYTVSFVTNFGILRLLTILGRDKNYSEKQNRAISNQTVARMTYKLIATSAFEGKATATNLAEKIVKFLSHRLVENT